MTALKEKVLKVLASSKDNVVPYYATSSEANLQELSEAIVELVKMNINPVFKNVTNETIELNFVAMPEQKLQVGRVVKFKEPKEINSEYELNDKWFVKELRDLADGHEVILNQFVGDETIAVALYKDSWEALTDSFEYIH